MDASRFDIISRSLSTTPTRRLTVRALTALGLVAVSGPATAAKKKGGKKKCKDKGDSCPTCPESPCAPKCTGKTCGPDGCGGSCGACTGGTCRSGTCDCSGNDTETEVCGGNCVAPCPSDRARNPFTCACCIATGERSGNSQTCAQDCCSGVCGLIDAIVRCLGGVGTCQFDAQCASGVCQANGTC